jgi:hypothetical protein
MAWINAVMVCLVISAWSMPLIADDYRLSLDFDGTGSECLDDDNVSDLLAGSMQDVCVFVLTADPNDSVANPPYQGITYWSWPDGLTIEVDTAHGDSEFQPLPDLLVALEIHYYLPWFLVQDDSIWRATGVVPTSWHRSPEYCFLYSVPADLAGHQLRLRVQFQHPVYGTLAVMDSMEVVAPCSATDLDRLRDSYTHFADKAMDYSIAVALADSLIAVGWRSQIGLADASRSASSAHDYEKALEFLDLCYQTHGTVNTPGYYNPSDTAGSRQFYEVWRSMLVDSLSRKQKH